LDEVRLNDVTCASILSACKAHPQALESPSQPPQSRRGAQSLDAASRKLEEQCARKDGAPNADQQAVLRIFATYVDSCAAVQPSASPPPSPPLIFLDGPGGTGKSFVFKCLEEIAEAAGNSILPTALTGVACTAIHTKTPARTAASLFDLGIDPVGIEPLDGTHLALLASSLANVVAVIIDEISFANASIVAAIDMCVSRASFTVGCVVTHAYFHLQALATGHRPQ